MSTGRAVTKLAALGATIAGIVFFWRKRHDASETPTPPTAADGA